MDLSDINLLDRDRYTEGIPHEWFTYLRHHAPIYRHPEPNGPGFWVFSKHEDVIAVGRDAKTFSSAAERGGVIMLEEPEVPVDMSLGANFMLMMDPPGHTRYRKLVNRGFTPRMVNALEPHIRDLTVRIVEDAVAAHEVDFVTDVAAELPLQVIAEMLGVPHEDRHQIFDWSNRMVGSEDPEYQVSDEAVLDAQVGMFMYAQQLAEQRRGDPRDDIITKLLEADVDGDELTEMDFNVFFLLLAVAGNETTRNTIAHGINAFLEHPDQWDRLVADPTLMDSAVEEVLRWATPVMYFRRNVTTDVDYKGHQLRAGDKVGIWYVSANRDEDVFEDPFMFDIGRDPNPHIAFGGGGPHHCLGANLARMEIRLLFEEMVARVRRMEPAGELSRLRSNFIGGIKHLPVRLEPVTSAAVL
ncbi:MAG: cytochrome P450 [Actinobacteria bacterium]|nr:cytochrome P450 [Actinomycetota bacterium]